MLPRPRAQRAPHAQGPRRGRTAAHWLPLRKPRPVPSSKSLARTSRHPSSSTRLSVILPIALPSCLGGKAFRIAAGHRRRSSDGNPDTSHHGDAIINDRLVSPDRCSQRSGRPLLIRLGEHRRRPQDIPGMHGARQPDGNPRIRIPKQLCRLELRRYLTCSLARGGEVHAGLRLRPAGNIHLPATQREDRLQPKHFRSPANNGSIRRLGPSPAALPSPYSRPVCACRSLSRRADRSTVCKQLQPKRCRNGARRCLPGGNRTTAGLFLASLPEHSQRSTTGLGTL